MFFYSIALYDGGPRVWKDCGGVDLVGEGFVYFAKLVLVVMVII